MSSSKKRLLMAVACGVVAAGLLLLYAGDVRAQAASSRAQALASYGGEQVEVLVATRDIAAGETLDASNASFEVWLADLLPVGAVLDTAEAFGKTTAVPFLKNEPIVLAKLGEGATQIVVPDGLCAVSIPSDDVQAIGGALGSGMLVDIYAVGSTAVSLVAQNVLVLETSNGFGAGSVGSGASASGSLFGGSSARAPLKWVTVAVDAQTVQELLVAARERNLALVLPGNDVPRELAAQQNGSSRSGASASNASASSASASGSSNNDGQAAGNNDATSENSEESS
ncbi:MAG: Flp pilus assembly protein CpaB [Coriobacteriales bacterium]|jgi:pilus assembly protein CpaB|nr:Flp pilus assembly protein CpaB [Coriobacteriales bacterium]